MMQTALAFIFTIGVIIFVHELGHFLAARAVGIYVHRFSIGFGPILLRWRALSTEWALSLLPFGGYVKMAGMEAAPMEGEVPEGEEDLPPDALYRNKKLPQRAFAIVAGPLANLILAVALNIGLTYSEGEPIYPGTWVDEPAQETPAAAAGLSRGDRILALDGEPMNNWNQLSDRIRAEGSGELRLSVEREGARFERTIVIEGKERNLSLTGLLPLMDNRVGKVLKDGPADRLGLQRGDRIVAVDGEPVRFFDSIALIINAKPEETVDLVWERDGIQYEGEVTPLAADVPDPESEGSLIKAGRIYFEPYLDWRSLGLGEAVVDGSKQVGYTIWMTLSWLGKQISGQGSLDSVGGPIQIAKVAGEMSRWGFSRLLWFVAFFSTQLFLLNLLPVPVLDGGHLVFLALEGLGHPVSELWRIRLTMAGLFLLLGFMALIVFNDAARLFF